MNKLLIGAAVAALTVAMAPAAAQLAPPPGVAPETSPAPIAPAAPRVQMRIMHMADKTMTRDEIVGHVRDMFARVDTNRDGFVTRDELDAAHQAMMGMRGGMPNRAARFDRLDTNHDGAISRQEYMAAQPQIAQQRVVVMREGNASAAPGQPGTPGMKMRMHRMGMAGLGGHLFDIADTNHDARVSLQEATAAALQHFDRADLNHDGKLTPEERQQAHQLMRGQRRPA